MTPAERFEPPGDDAGPDEVSRRRNEYDAYAARYDADTDWYDRLMLGGARQRVCARARGLILEVCVGSGRNLGLYDASVQVVGVDLSGEMLQLARPRAEAAATRVDLVQGDAARLPFAARSFDTVVCTLGLSSVPDDAAAVAEIARVLRPDGVLHVLGHVRADRRAGRLVQRVLNRTASARVGDTQDREVLPLLLAHEFDVRWSTRRRLGIIEETEAAPRA